MKQRYCNKRVNLVTIWYKDKTNIKIYSKKIEELTVE